MTAQHKYTDEEIMHLKLSMDNPIYFIENFVQIPHPETGVADMRLFDHQNIIIDAFQQNQFITQKMSRNMGNDTILAAYALWFAIFKNDRSIVMLGSNRNDTQRFAELVRNMYHSVPDWVKPKLTRNTKSELGFESGSRIMCRIGTPDSVRGMAISLLLMVDFDRFRHAEELIAGALPALQAGFSKCIITASGHKPHYFNNLHESDNFHHLEFAWYHHPDRNELWATNMKSQIGTEAFRDEYNLGVA